eukprot:TRINITY_DN230_c1_g2_i1.p1 TRINITY_DN230_c1_g2~~TRINITY_DN230_c1_g2_i1.p1  ORF type:complete len:381 (-),score=176.84 TRINITY_DN230_c1_g2_i1:1129-2226(-)
MATQTLKIENNESNVENWLSKIDDNKYITELSIPGTHNSAALKGAFSICQNKNILKQLEIGIRFLDIRCRHVQDNFLIYHGVCNQNLTFQEICEICYQFLEKNPKETILMLINKENKPKKNKLTFEQCFLKLIENKKEEFWFLLNQNAQLFQVRRKIILLRRFKAKNELGINVTKWANNTTFTIQNESIYCEIQDAYIFVNWKAKQKLMLMRNLFSKITTSNTNIFFINYASASGGNIGIPDPKAIARRMNKYLYEYLEQNQLPRLGIVVVDFINKKMAKLIINHQSNQLNQAIEPPIKIGTTEILNTKTSTSNSNSNSNSATINESKIDSNSITTIITTNESTTNESTTNESTTNESTIDSKIQ